MRAEVKHIESGNYFGVFIGDAEIRRTQHLFRANSAAQVINENLDHEISSAEQQAYSEGWDDGYQKAIREVAEGR